MRSTRRLFDVGPAAGDVLAHDSFLDRARAERERDNDAEARQALGGYLVARLIDRLLELTGSDDDAQSFAWQVEGCRRFVGDLADTSEVSHLRGIIDAVKGDPAYRTSVVRVSLSAYAYFLEHEGRWSEALDVLALSARVWGEPVPARDLAALSLFAGRLNRLLARWDRANDAYRLAEEAALEAGDSYSASRARLGRGAVARGQGNYPQARALAEAVIASAGNPEQSDILGMAYGDLGAVLARMGLRIESLQATYQWFLRTTDPVQRAAALGDLGIMLAQLGAIEGARCAFEMVVDSGARFQLSANARLELMQIEGAAGNRVAFERHRAEARKLADRMPPSMGVDYRFKLGTGFARFGQLERARTVWEEARAMAEAHGLNDWYFKADQALAGLDKAVVPTSEAGLTALERDVGADAVIAEIGAGLLQHKELARA